PRCRPARFRGWPRRPRSWAPARLRAPGPALAPWWSWYREGPRRRPASFLQFLFEELRGDVHEIALRHDPDETFVLHDREASDVVRAHERDGLQRGRVRRNGDQVAAHDLGNGHRHRVLVEAAPGEEPEHGAIGDQPHQAVLLVFHRNMPDLLPLHEV